VAPAGISTVLGDTLTFVMSLLVSSMLTPFPVAGVVRETVSVPVVLTTIVAGPDMTTDPGGATVTVAVAAGMPAAVAVIVVDPVDTLVTRTPTLEEVALMDTLGLTVAIPGLLDARAMSTPPAGAGPDSINVRIPSVPFPVMIKLDGVMERV
jgi:hypothetical protein